MPRAAQATIDLLNDYFDAMEMKDHERLCYYYADDVSLTFANAPTLSRLLKHLVEQTINGAADQLKEYSLGVDREIGRRLAVAIAYVGKTGSNFIGWRDVGGEYRRNM